MQASEDSGTQPVNEVNFKILLDAKHEGGHYFKVKYNWFQPGAATADGKPTFDNLLIDSGFLKDWTLIQIEGQTPVDQSQPEEPVKGGKKAPPAKADKKAAAALEEITDNRPRQISHTKNFQDEGVASVKGSESFAKFFEGFLFSVQIWQVNRETQEEKKREELSLDLTALLNSTKDGDELVYKFDKLKTLEFLYLNVHVCVDKPILTGYLRNKLNPLQVDLVACKDIPYKTEPKYKPIFSIFRFVDGRQFRTLDMPQQQNCRFNQKHVFLVGAMDHVQLRERLATQIVEVELHDCDEFIANKEDEANAKFSAGKAKFTFRDFLRPFTLELKLRSDIFPMKREEVDNTQNLDLNTTARKNEKTVEKASPYLLNSTYSVIIATLARPIGPFDEKAELEAWKAQRAAEKAAEAGMSSPSPDQEIKPGAEPTSPKSRLGTSSSQRVGTAASNKMIPYDIDGAIFERLIIIIPYKSPEIVKQIEDSFEKVNCHGLKLDNARYMSTKEFTPEERKDRTLDFLSGFCLMDSETRMYILEGLGGEGRGVHQFYQQNLRQRPNDRKYTLLYNPDVRFKNRQYLDFNCLIKKIKLREPLRQIMGAPDVYLRSKVPEDMYHIL